MFKCRICRDYLKSQETLKRHEPTCKAYFPYVKKVKRKFKCLICDSTDKVTKTLFNARKSIYNHIGHKHKEILIVRRNQVRCGFCMQMYRRDSKHQKLCAQFSANVHLKSEIWHCKFNNCETRSNSQSGIFFHCYRKHRKDKNMQNQPCLPLTQQSIMELQESMEFDDKS